MDQLDDGNVIRGLGEELCFIAMVAPGKTKHSQPMEGYF
jgi:hypothetical protein